MGQRTDVHHVGNVIFLFALEASIANELVDRNAIVGDVVPLGQVTPIVVVDADAAGRQNFDIFMHRGGVEGNEQLGGVPPGDVPFMTGANVVPGGQALDVGREDVFAVDRDTHFEQGAQNGQVGGLAASAVGGGNHNRKVVDDRRPFAIFWFVGNGRFVCCFYYSHN